MPILAAALLLAEPAAPAFPEQVPGLIAACLDTAVASGEVSETEDSHKYICGGDVALRFWTFLEGAGIAPYEQDTPQGKWLGREFPLGGCFRRTRMPDGSAATGGLSCTVWIPRARQGTGAQDR
ncbi:hypothetical protein GCM10011380_33710 [Sphingomonas metalli]|uniref:Uncharacterized protein n=1 Tax=Sphingomonas metalli TaxID=1779358 RepID=A0A916TDW9_9SPHN|nr:hypothetical protein [Sphingomonas metalli]GGB41496.1 hypothetical protein GCM10011380_33710 [Sphingomonas metalli]